MNETSTTIESLVFGAREWMWVAIALTLTLAVLAIWSYAAASRLSGLRFLTMVLKIAAVALLAFCLLEPMRRIERPRPGANLMAIVVDNSRSMEMKPPGDTTSRVARIRPLLNSESGWQSRLAQDFEVRRYAFDERLQSQDSLDELEFDGNYSSLAGSVEELKDRFANRPVAGMMLFTDGLSTDDLEGLLTSEFKFPIFPVTSELQTELKDVAIEDTSVVMSSFELAPATVDANVVARGFAGENIVVRLLDRAGATLDQQVVLCDSDEFSRRIRFQFKPISLAKESSNFQVVRVRAMLESDDSDTIPADMVSQNELTLANNSRVLAVDPGKGPFRLLYVAGRPNWEFKFIRRALSEDPELEFNALIRIAKKQPKFSFREMGVDSANPLLAGFSDNADADEQYDEPVLKPMGKDETLKAGFPSGAEDLFRYHAVILDDVEANFFSLEQMQLLRDFVATRGGGLMMLGGQESFLGGDYDETPLSDLLPVYVRGREVEKQNEPARFTLSREGELEPWLRLRDNRQKEQVRMQQMPEFLTWNKIRETKPGASVLANITTINGSQPALVTQRFGKGRTLAFVVGDFWRWAMRRPETDTNDLAQNWRQTARWITGDVPKRVEVEIAEPDDPTGPHQISIRVRDAKYKLLDNAEIAIEVTEPDGSKISTSAKVSEQEAGLYLAEYWSKSDGGYLCNVKVQEQGSEESIMVETGWTAQPSAREFSRVLPDTDSLRRLAEKSGGEIVNEKDIAQFVSSLPTRKVPIMEARVEPLWHRPWLVLCAIGCLVLEWGIRRWKGMP